MEADWRKTHQWAHGLCGCFDNASLCVVAFCVPCLTFGQTSEAMGKSCIVYGLLLAVPFVGCFLEADERRDIRAIRGIPGSFFEDLLIVSFCQPCALVQESQEVELLQAEERAHASGAVIRTQPTGVAVIGSAESRDAPKGLDNPGLQQEYQPGYNQPSSPHPNPMVAGLNFNPPILATDEAEQNMNRE